MATSFSARQGTSKAEAGRLLAEAAAERAVRAAARQRAAAALLIQRLWRGCRSRARTRAALLDAWRAHFGSAAGAHPTSAVASLLLPPLLLSTRNNNAATLGTPLAARALALLLPSLPDYLQSALPTQARSLARFCAQLAASPPEAAPLLPELASRALSQLLASPRLGASALAAARDVARGAASGPLPALLLDAAARAPDDAAVADVGGWLLRASLPGPLEERLAALLPRMLPSLQLGPADEASAALEAAGRLLQRAPSAPSAAALLAAAARRPPGARLSPTPRLLACLLSCDAPPAALCALFWPPVGAAELNALAFSPTLLSRVWAGYLAAALRVPAELGEGDGAEMPLLGRWDHLQGVAALPAAVLPSLSLFATCFSHLLHIMDEQEFRGSEGSMPLHASRAAAAAVNALAVTSLLSAAQLSAPQLAARDASLRLLRALLARDARRRLLPAALWARPARDAPPMQPAAAARALAPGGGGLGDALLAHAPHARPLAARLQLLRDLSAADKAAHGGGAQPGAGASAGAGAGAGAPAVQLTVRRAFLLEDLLTGLGGRGAELRGRLAVQFVSEAGATEAGIDIGGPFRELLTRATSELADPRRGLLQAAEKGGLAPTPAAAASAEGRALLRLAGLLAGKALYEGVTLPLELSPPFASLLLRRPLSLDDVEALDAELYRSLMTVKRYQGDVAELGLSFEASCADGAGGVLSAELPGGGGEVTEENRLAYVAAVADWRLSGSLAAGAEAFRSGLCALIHPGWLALFSPAELGPLLSGGAKDWRAADLRPHAELSGYAPASRTLRNFWAAVDEMTQAQRAMLLAFVTGCARLPHGGFRNLQPRFCIAKVAVPLPLLAPLTGEDVERLPTASTCFCRLSLPNYRSRRRLRDKLLLAIQSGAGFENS